MRAGLGRARLDPGAGPETTRYGGNTSCVQVTLGDGNVLVLDAGTGIRTLGLSLPGDTGPLHLLLTHLHLDHIQGLMFFAPLFRPGAEIVVWGPEAPEAPLLDRIARYISAPLSPIEVRELPCHVSFREAPNTEWTIGRRHDPGRLGHPPRPHARLPHQRGRHLALLPPRPRAGSGRRARGPGAGVDLGLRAGSRRHAAAARQPVLR